MNFTLVPSPSPSNSTTHTVESPKDIGIILFVCALIIITVIAYIMICAYIKDMSFNKRNGFLKLNNEDDTWCYATTQPDNEKTTTITIRNNLDL